MCVPPHRSRSTPSTTATRSSPTSATGGGTACSLRRVGSSALPQHRCRSRPLRPGPPQVALLRLPAHLTADLYEHVALELLDAGERDTARALVRNTAALLALRQDAPPRAQRLDSLLGGAAIEATHVWPGGHSGRDAARQHLATALAGELEQAAPSRLLALLAQALKWQRHTGALTSSSSTLGLLCPVPDARLLDELVARVPGPSVRLPRGVAATAVCYAPDGSALVVGMSDGMLEVRDSRSGVLRTDAGYAYQAGDGFMLHPGDVAITAVAVSPDAELLASADAAGGIRVWRLATGACVRRWAAAHAGGVASLAFSVDGTQILSAGTDGAARVHGLRSGQLLRELRGHDGFVTSALYLPPAALPSGAGGDGFILTGGADGTLRLHDARGGDLLAVCTMPAVEAAGDAPSDSEAPSRPPPGVVHVQLLPPAAARAAAPDEVARVLVATASGSLCILGVPSGRVGHTFTLPAAAGTAFTAGCVSRRGSLVYGATAQGGWVAFNATTGHVEHISSPGDSAPTREHRGAHPLVVCHPHRNAAATLTADGALCMWHS